MPKFKTVEKVEHNADDMFNLVADIERYPEFLGLCKNLAILETQKIDKHIAQTARMTVGYKAITESFTSMVILRKDEGIITMTNVDGPFKYLNGQWTFLGGGEQTNCEIEFTIDYSFKSKTLQILVGSLFDKMFANFVNAFKKRADQVYD